MKKNCENCRHGCWESDGDYGQYSHFVCEKREDDGYNNLDDNLSKESYRQKAKVCCDLMIEAKCCCCGAVELSTTEVEDNYLCFDCWLKKEHGKAWGDLNDCLPNEAGGKMKPFDITQYEWSGEAKGCGISFHAPAWVMPDIEINIKDVDGGDNTAVLLREHAIAIARHFGLTAEDLK